MHYENAFTVPIMGVSTKINVEPMIDYAYELMSKDKGRTVSNYNGWQSDVLDNKLPVFKDLVFAIEELANDFHKKIDLKHTLKQILDNMWFNINPTGGSIKPHAHPNSIFSGVFYLKTPEKSGNINFINPNQRHEYHFTRDNVERYGEYTFGEFRHTPEVSKLVMFPSSLEHYVDGNASVEDRISIAFNTKCI